MKKIPIILISALIVVVFVAYRVSNAGVFVCYKVSYTIAANGKKIKRSGVFMASVKSSDEILAIAGEAIPIPLPDGRILILSLSGGEPMLIPDRSVNSWHSITPDKFFLFAFSDYTNIIVLRESIEKLKLASPTVTVDPRILPAIYFSTEPHSRKNLTAIPRDELVNHNIKILSIQVSVTEERITEGRMERLFPWLRSGNSDRQQVLEFIQK